MNIGLFVGFFIIAFSVAGVLTYLYPDMILPGYSLLMPGASSLRNAILHVSRIVVNGLVYGFSIGIVAIVSKTLILKGKKILQN